MCSCEACHNDTVMMAVCIAGGYSFVFLVKNAEGRECVLKRMRAHFDNEFMVAVTR